MRKGIDIIKQVKEKLGKSADAGDYIDDFKKSDAPQFKGKSDKKKEKMAVAAYLDSKEEVDLEEVNDDLEMVRTNKGGYRLVKKSPEEKRQLKDLTKHFDKKKSMQNMVVMYSLTADPSKLKRMTTNKYAKQLKKLDNQMGTMKMQGDKYDHLDFVKYMHDLGVKPTIKVLKAGVEYKEELDKEDETSIKKVIKGLKKAVDAHSGQVKSLTKDIQDEKRQLKDPKKEAMVMKVKDSGSIQVIDKKDLEKYLRKGYIQVENNIQEALKLKYAVVDTSNNNEVIAMSSDEKEMQYTMRRRKERSLKVVKLKRPTTNDKMIGYPLKEENCPDCDEDPCKCKSLQESGHTDVASMKTQVQIATDALQKMNTELGKLSDEEDLPTWWTNKVATAVSKLDGMADYIGAKQNMGKTMKEEYKSLNESAIGCLQTAMIDNNKSLKKESKMGELFLDMQMDAQEMDEREFIKMYTKKGFQAAELKSLYKEFSEEVVKEVVDNSLMSQATRVISQTAIQEKIDPADVDNIATADDRKAADKNIIIQLRRAQDMKGKADVTFKDNPKKKEKIDIRVINKVLDMFDSLRPNDKAKMQTTIGKSYRDLLKTVQRGR